MRFNIGFCGAAVRKIFGLASIFGRATLTQLPMNPLPIVVVPIAPPLPVSDLRYTQIRHRVCSWNRRLLPLNRKQSAQSDFFSRNSHGMQPMMHITTINSTWFILCDRIAKLLLETAASVARQSLLCCICVRVCLSEFNICNSKLVEVMNSSHVDDAIVTKVLFAPSSETEEANPSKTRLMNSQNKTKRF